MVKIILQNLHHVCIWLKNGDFRVQVQEERCTFKPAPEPAPKPPKIELKSLIFNRTSKCPQMQRTCNEVEIFTLSRDMTSVLGCKLLEQIIEG